MQIDMVLQFENVILSQNNGENVKSDFFCHRESRQQLKKVNSSKEKRNKISSRCECKAHLRITL